MAVAFQTLCSVLVVLTCARGSWAEAKRLSPRVVTTKYGSLRGILVPVANRHLQPVEVFLGVPYASAPVGALRFMPPVTPPPWSGVRMADQLSPVCPQRLPDISNETEALSRMPQGRLEYLKRLLPYLKNQSEDCLYLNIYLPAAAGKPGPNIPVLMFIHGESYDWNSGNPYDGSVLASFTNMVVVTINYRLGILGFLPAMEGASRGNFGLMDQVAALHWIQENIVEFGGDPKVVAIFGQGYGASCVNLLMLSPMAKGLFHRAIMHSGSALSPWSIASESSSYSNQLAKDLKCPTRDNRTMVGCMRQRPLSEIMKLQYKVPKYLSAFGPMVDGVVVPKDPESLMEDPNSLYSNYDLLFGVTRMEAYPDLSSNDEKHGIKPDRRDRIIRTLVRNLFTYHLREIFLTVVNEYTDWNRPIQHPKDILEGVSEALGDALVVAPLVRAGIYHANVNPNTFYYVFAHQTEHGDYPSEIGGCIHGEELPYVFGAPLVGSMGHFPRNYTRAEVALSEAVMTYWTNFVRTGNLTTFSQEGETSSDRNKGRFEKLNWPPYDGIHQRYLLLGMKPKIRDHYHAHRLSYWLHLIPKLHQPGNGTSTPDHHLLEDHDNKDTYDGTIRRACTPVPFLTTPATHPGHHPHGIGGAHLLEVYRMDNRSVGTVGGVPDFPDGDVAMGPTPEATGSALSANQTESMVVVVHHRTYTTALSVTIAIGCSLLILNLLIFAGMCYQRDRNRSEVKRNTLKYQVGMPFEDKVPPATIKRKQPLAHVAPTTGRNEATEFLLTPTLAAQVGNCYVPAIPPRPKTITTDKPSIAETEFIESNLKTPTIDSPVAEMKVY